MDLVKREVEAREASELVKLNSLRPLLEIKPHLSLQLPPC